MTNVFALQLLQSGHQPPARVFARYVALELAAWGIVCRLATAHNEPAGCRVELGGDQEPKAVSIVSRCFSQPVEAREPCLDSVPTDAVLVPQLQAVDCKRLKFATHSIDRNGAMTELWPLYHSARNATVGSIVVAARAGQ